MFCPECKAEYRPGFTRCSDCDVDLVVELPKEGPEELRRVWTGDSQADCIDACFELRDAGLRYKVAQAAAELTLGMGVAWKFEIRVSCRDYDRARAALGITAEPGGIRESTDEAVLELSASQAPAEQRSPTGRARWRPSDAVVEIWSQKAQDTSSVVELSMDTNLIRFRTQVKEDGTRSFFVAPEDESLAREIVRQIRDGTPPR